MRGRAPSAIAIVLAYGCATTPPVAEAPEEARRNDPAPAPRAEVSPRTPAPAPLESATATSWFAFRIAEVRWCKSPSVPAQRALGVGVELENRGDAWLQVRDHEIELYGGDDRKVVRSLPPIGSECPTDKLGVLRPRETKRAWLYFAPATESTRDLALGVRLREPHGFDVASLRLALPSGRSAQKIPPSPAAPARPAGITGIAPPIESAFYRVTVTATRLCNSGAALPDGRRLLGVEVLLENFARVELEPSYTARVLDAAGYEYESVITEQAGCEPKARVGAQVMPGDEYRSWLWAFPVPGDARELVLVYRVRGSALDAWEEVRIPIGELPSPG